MAEGCEDYGIAEWGPRQDGAPGAVRTRSGAGARTSAARASAAGDPLDIGCGAPELRGVRSGVGRPAAPAPCSADADPPPVPAPPPPAARSGATAAGAPRVGRAGAPAAGEGIGDGAGDVSRNSPFCPGMPDACGSQGVIYPIPYLISGPGGPARQTSRLGGVRQQSASHLAGASRGAWRNLTVPAQRHADSSATTAGAHGAYAITRGCCSVSSTKGLSRSFRVCPTAQGQMRRWARVRRHAPASSTRCDATPWPGPVPAAAADSQNCPAAAAAGDPGPVPYTASAPGSPTVPSRASPWPARPGAGSRPAAPAAAGAPPPGSPPAPEAGKRGAWLAGPVGSETPENSAARAPSGSGSSPLSERRPLRYSVPAWSVGAGVTAPAGAPRSAPPGFAPASGGARGAASSCAAAERPGHRWTEPCGAAWHIWGHLGQRTISYIKDV